MAVLDMWDSRASAPKPFARNKCSRIQFWSLLLCPLLAAVGLLSGCSGISWGTGSSTPPPPQEKAFAIDAVKLISPEMTRGDDERSFSQARYRITPTARLLMRYEILY